MIWNTISCGWLLVLLTVQVNAQGKFFGGSGSGFAGATGSGAPLPVALLHFTAQAYTSDAVELTWETATEVNSDHFVLEQSTDGENFFEIAVLPAAGNSNQPLYYHHRDYPGATGFVYYRLHQVDQNGDRQTFPVEVVRLDNHSSIKIYPNPSRGEVIITGLQGHFTLRDALGNIRFHLNLISGSSLPDLSSLPAGHYWLVSEDDPRLRALPLVRLP